MTNLDEYRQWREDYESDNDMKPSTFDAWQAQASH